MSNDTNFDRVARRQKGASTEIQKENERRGDRKKDVVLQFLDSTPYSRAFELAKERRTTVSKTPLEEHGFCLSKAAYRNALGLQYNWPLKNVASHCVFGKAFMAEHCLSCPTGGFQAIQHNEVRDITAEKLTEVCSNVMSNHI